MTSGGEGKGARGTSTRLLLAVVVAAILVSVLNQTFTNVVVPDIQRDYGVTQGQAGWVSRATCSSSPSASRSTDA